MIRRVQKRFYLNSVFKENFEKYVTITDHGNNIRHNNILLQRPNNIHRLHSAAAKWVLWYNYAKQSLNICKFILKLCVPFSMNILINNSHTFLLKNLTFGHLYFEIHTFWWRFSHEMNFLTFKWFSTVYGYKYIVSGSCEIIKKEICL